jgi:hypothetical protein
MLQMAQAKKLNLTRPSIAALIEQFAGALAAATLTELWSRLLLPADPGAARAAEAGAEALRRQLLARERMRQEPDWL